MNWEDILKFKEKGYGYKEVVEILEQAGYHRGFIYKIINMQFPIKSAIKELSGRNRLAEKSLNQYSKEKHKKLIEDTHKRIAKRKLAINKLKKLQEKRVENK